MSTQELEIEIQRVQDLWSECRDHYGHEGPWLFGHFTVADCMYIPVALRFITYGARLGPMGFAYLQTVQQHPPVQEWLAAAQQESDIMEASEVGIRNP